MWAAAAQLMTAEATEARTAQVTARDLYAQHRQKVLQLCLRYGAGNRAWAEDVTHDVFVTLLEQLPRLGARDDLGGWVCRVTANTCLTRLRREGSVWGRVARALGAGPTSTAETPERQVSVRQDLRAAQQELARMPANERVVFCMRYLDDVQQTEIAVALGLSKGYVSKLLSRAEARLRRRGWDVEASVHGEATSTATSGLTEEADHGA